MKVDVKYVFCLSNREQISNSTDSSSEDGTCPDIPSGLVIEMLVTEAGKYAGVPQMEIVGTKVK